MHQPTFLDRMADAFSLHFGEMDKRQNQKFRSEVEQMMEEYGVEIIPHVSPVASVASVEVL